MDVEGAKDAISAKKMEKVTMRKKKREAKSVPELVEHDQLSKVEKKKKKDERKTENCTKESEHKDAKSSATDCTIPLPILVEDGVQYDKTEKKKKKEDRKPEVGSKTSNQKIHGKDLPEVVNNYQNENNEKKKKKDKNKPEVGSETNIVEIVEKIRAEADDYYRIEKALRKKKKIEQEVDKGKVSRNGGEVKERRKKKSKEEKRKNVNDSVSIPTEIVKDGERFETVKDQTEKNKKKKNREMVDNRGKGESTGVKTVEETINADTTEKNKKKKNREMVDNRGKGESTGVKTVEETINADTSVSEEVEKKRRREKNEGKNPKDGDKERDCESTAVGLVKKSTNADRNVSEKVEKKRKREKDKGKDPNDGEKEGNSKSTAVEIADKVTNADSNVSEKGKKKRKRERNMGKDLKDGKKEGDIEPSAVEHIEKLMNADINASEKVEKKRRKREKNMGKDLKDGEKEGDKRSNDEDSNAIESNSKDSKPKKKKKKVSFSDHDEVFPLEGGIVQGKRFTPEEDEIVKQAVFDYIDAHGLGEDGLNMVLHCKSHPKLKHCWKEIGEALPHRPFISVYDRAHSLFERDEARKWSNDEIEIIRKFHAEHGPKWRQLADAMGKHRRHVKDAWRRTKLSNRKRGHWSQEEYQNLFDLVNVDLRAKVNEEKKSKHGMLRDNICWSAISDKLASRTFVSCCIKWYDQLTSSMVKDGEWADTDDYHLIDALYTLDACCIEDVDWDCLLEHRSGDVCRKRWKQMSNHIGEPGKKLSFVEQVEILSKRYRAEMLEPREIWDNKPRAP